MGWVRVIKVDVRTCRHLKVASVPSRGFAVFAEKNPGRGVKIRKHTNQRAKERENNSFFSSLNESCIYGLGAGRRI